MIKTLLKRVNEKDQMISDLQAENVRLAKECANVMDLKSEIERLKAHIESTRTMAIFRDHQAEIERLRDQVTCLETYGAVKSAEIERLKAQGLRVTELYGAAVETLVERDKLITELCDALDAFGNGIVTMGWAKAQDIEPLIQRAREATR